MQTEKVIFESGATSHAVNDLILFTDNTPQTAQLRDEIYSDWRNVGNFGTTKLYERFIPLFESARKHYINEFKYRGVGHIIAMSKEEIAEYCQLFVKDFDNWKFEHPLI